MAYDPYNAVNAIYRLKEQWTDAYNNKDTAKQDEVAKKAREYYNQLRNNGYGSVADKLESSSYEAAKDTNDYYGKTNKSKTRKYFYDLGKANNLSHKQIDDLISWDDTTGEISFGGKNIGKPDSVVDGVSYWKDTDVLKKAYDDYVQRSGLTRSKESLVNQENENLVRKINKAYDDLMNTNPFTTDEAKTIMGKYDLSALQGRDNAIASGASSNGGNIDSFAAANAMRQQASLIAKGQEAVLSAYQSKLNHARNLLSDMGVNIERIYNEDETSKNNQVSRDAKIAEVTGVVPTNMLYSMPYYSQFFNTDGTLKNEDIDYKAEIDKAVKNKDENLAKILRAARGAKIYSDYEKYGKYAEDGDYTIPRESMQTEAGREFDEQNKTSKEIATAQSYNAMMGEQAKAEAEKASSDKELEIARINAQNKLDQILLEDELNNKDRNINGNSSGAQNTLSEAGKNAIKNRISRFNKDYKGVSYSGKGENDDVILSDGKGNYYLNKNITKSGTYTKPFIKAILQDKNISDADAQILFDMLGIDSSEILGVSSYTDY